MLERKQSTLFETTKESKLFHQVKLPETFIKIIAMTPDEYRTDVKKLLINYSFAESLFGSILIASSSKGICYLAFVDEESTALSLLKNYFAHANFKKQIDLFQQKALLFFSNSLQKENQIILHIKGTEFQFKVWETLLKIPLGKLSTYGNIAMQIDKPGTVEKSVSCELACRL